MQLRRDCEHQALEAADHVETAVTGGSRVVRMPFEEGADLENLAALKRAICQFVQPFRTPIRTAALLPRPRDCGISPSIEQEKENGRCFVRSKKARAAEPAIAGTERPRPRLTVTSS